MADIVSNQLARQLTEMVDNFTLLDILSKEEQEEVLSRKIDNIQSKNEERLRRHQEIEADKASATGGMSPLASPTTTSPTVSHTVSHTSTSRGGTSPVTATSPTSWGAGSSSSSSSSAGSRPGSGGGGRSGGGNRRRGGGGGGPPSPAVDYPAHVRNHTDVHVIELTNTGSGLGFGLVEFKGRGVAVKTIVKGGAAALDGRLETGDLLLSIDDTDVEGKSRDDVVDILKLCKGTIRLYITREMIQTPSSSSYPHQQPSRGRRGGQRGGGGYHREVSREENRKELQITVHNEIPSSSSSNSKKDKSFNKSQSRRKVHKTENLTISVDSEPSHDGSDIPAPSSRGRGSRGRGRGSRGGRGRGGRAPAMNRDEVLYKEWEEKKQANIDLVEAEIQAMREAYEAEKNASPSGAGNTSMYSFLDDPRRHEPSHHSPDASTTIPTESTSRKENTRQHGSTRSQHSWGGQQFDNVVNKISKAPRGRGGGSGSGGTGPQSKHEMQVTMTGKERREYEQWKREREEIDKDRIARHQKHAGKGGGNWARDQQPESTGDSNSESWGQSQSSWSAKRADNYRDIRVYGGGFNGHDDRWNDMGTSSSQGTQPTSQCTSNQTAQPTSLRSTSQAAQPSATNTTSQVAQPSAPESLQSEGPQRGRGRGRGRRSRGSSFARGGQAQTPDMSRYSEGDGNGPVVEASSHVPGGPESAQVPGGPTPGHVPGGPEPAPLPERFGHSQAPGGPGTPYVPGGPAPAAVTGMGLLSIGPPPRGGPSRLVQPKGDVEIHIPGVGPPPALGNIGSAPLGGPSRLVQPKGAVEVHIPGVGPPPALGNIGPAPHGAPSRLVQPKGDVEVHLPGVGPPPPALVNLGPAPRGGSSRLVQPKGDVEVHIPGVGPPPPLGNIGPAPHGAPSRLVQPKGDVEVHIPGIGPPPPLGNLGPVPHSAPSRLVQPKGDVEVHIPGVGPPRASGLVSSHVPGAPGPSQIQGPPQQVPGGPGISHASAGYVPGGCPPEGALAVPIGVWQPTDEHDVTLAVGKEPVEEKEEKLTIKTTSDPMSPRSPLSPGDGWTTPTGHRHVIDWAAEANNNATWDLPPVSPSNDMYAFNPNFEEAASSASHNWGDGGASGDATKGAKDSSEHKS